MEPGSQCLVLRSYESLFARIPEAFPLLTNTACTGGRTHSYAMQIMLCKTASRDGQLANACFCLLTPPHGQAPLGGHRGSASSLRLWAHCLGASQQRPRPFHLPNNSSALQSVEGPLTTRATCFMADSSPAVERTTAADNFLLIDFPDFEKHIHPRIPHVQGFRVTGEEEQKNKVADTEGKPSGQHSSGEPCCSCQVLEHLFALLHRCHRTVALHRTASTTCMAPQKERTGPSPGVAPLPSRPSQDMRHHTGSASAAAAEIIAELAGSKRHISTRVGTARAGQGGAWVATRGTHSRVQAPFRQDLPAKPCPAEVVQSC